MSYIYIYIYIYICLSEKRRSSIICCYFCCSVAQSCPTLCNPMDYSTSGLPIPHHLKFAQVHEYCISDAIQSSHALTPSSPSSLNLSQHHRLFQ